MCGLVLMEKKKHGTIEIGLERKWHPFITNAIDQYIKEQINVPVDIFAVTSVFELGLYKKSQINELKRQGEMMYQSLVSSQLQVRGG